MSDETIVPEVTIVPDAQTPKLGTQPTHASEVMPVVSEVEAAIASLEEVVALALAKLSAISLVRHPILNDVRSTLDFVTGHVSAEVRSLKARFIK
jgi:hypothetical protein